MSDATRPPDPSITETPEYSAWMDAIRTVEVVRQYKRHSFEMLHLQKGSRVLEVGCGTGDDARELMKLVGRSGRVVAIDISSNLLAEAQRRSAGAEPMPEFRLQDVHALEDPDESFDACRADRTFQHLEDPAGALAHMVRATRAGGYVCLCEPDWATMVVDSTHVELTDAILRSACRHVRHGWMGRQLRRRLREAGLAGIGVTPFTITATGYADAAGALGLEYSALQAERSGDIATGDAAVWLSELRAASEADTFFASATVFVAAGRRPAPEAAGGK